jgi:hypothetical protein
LLSARDALSPASDGATPQPGAQIAVDGSLREALNLFLAGAERIGVVDGSRVVGSLTFDDVRRAISPSPG